ncbi:MAG: NFACT family protein [Bacteroidota bacterium]
MITSYYTLQALAQEFDQSLRRATIREIFTQQKNELLISLEARSNAWTLTASTDPRMNYVFLRDPVARAKRNSVDIFPALFGKEVVKVWVHRNDRILQINVQDSGSICLQLFGNPANILLVNEDGVIVDAFKKSKDVVGKRLVVAQPNTHLDLLESETRFAEVLQSHASNTAFAAMKSAIPTLGSTLSREIFHRAHVDEKQQLTALDEKQMKIILSQLRALSEELRSPSPVIYFRERHPRAFSLVPLQHMAGSMSQAYRTVNEAVRTFVIATFRVESVEREKNVLLKVIKRELDKSQRSLQALTKELLEHNRAAEYERIANIIMGNLQHLTKGTKAVDLPDLYPAKRRVRITMDPKLTPAQNAKRYFDKVKKVRHALQQAGERSENLKSKIAILEKLQLHLDYCNTKEQLKEFQDQHRDELLALNMIKLDKPQEDLPFRVFTLNGGFKVWVGKSSEQNDLLTMKYAKPNDFWFHARGAGGSHVVLKVGSGKGEPGKIAKQQAASIAAYYSKMKNAKHVPVAYCERKFVRKPKGANPGSVVLEREKVIFVEPRLPPVSGA